LHRGGQHACKIKELTPKPYYGRFAGFLGHARDDAAAWRGLRISETSGRPLGSDAWIEALEAKTGRTLKLQKRGPTPGRE